MKRWYVVTPEYGTVIPVLDTGEGPMEYGADVIEIEADTARDAVALGVKVMLENKWRPNNWMRYKWCHNQQLDRLCPYTGVRAYPVGEEVPDWFPNEGDRQWWLEQHK